MSFKPSAAGKGDQPRPASVDPKTLQKNWDAIAWGSPPVKKKKASNEKKC